MANVELKNDEVRDLVLARLSVLSSDTAISIGSNGSFTRDELIEHVAAGDPVGKKFEEIQLEWLRSLKEGIMTHVADPDYQT